jgi:long-chain acyl-CoA synthetase
VLAHRNGIAVCHIAEENGTLAPGDTVYLYLPLAHVFAQIIALACPRLGGTIVYFGGNTREIIPELRRASPTTSRRCRASSRSSTGCDGAIPPERHEQVREA